jgi:hypothetical protein
MNCKAGVDAVLYPSSRTVGDVRPIPPLLPRHYVAENFFRREFYATSQARFTIVHQQARRIWSGMDKEARRKYTELESADLIIYRRDMAAYSSKYPEMDLNRPKRPLSACLVFKKGTKRTKGDWDALSAEEKVPYIREAEDYVRDYVEDVQEFKEWCISTGKDFEASIRAPKRKLRTESQSMQTSR